MITGGIMFDRMQKMIIVLSMLALLVLVARPDTTMVHFISDPETMLMTIVWLAELAFILISVRVLAWLIDKAIA
jgi:hypothetical protein